MIVQMKDAALYHSIFEEINADLSSAELNTDDTLPVENINSYFARIEDIVQLQKKATEENPKVTKKPYFLMMPFEEPRFIIDANTRKITIPSIFNNGISIVGDESAEIVYFEIDRYFDLQDLDQTEIIIQAQLPSGKKYISPAFNKTANYPNLPNKLIFGWIITQEITAEQGNIQFSVRFYKTEENKIIYSLNTLTHTIKVNPSLNFELNDKENTIQEIQKNSTILAYLRNSAKGDRPLLLNPAFCSLSLNSENIPIDNGIEFNEDAQSIGTIKGYVDLSNANDDKMVLYAKASYDYNTAREAVSVGSGVINEITYKWYYSSDNNRNNATEIKENNNNINIKDSYFTTTDSSYNNLDFYYITSEDPGTQGQIKLVTDLDLLNSDEFSKALERFTTAEIKLPGYYWVQAQNVSYGEHNKDQIETIQPFIVGGPCALSIETSVNPLGQGEYNVIIPDAEDKVTLTCQKVSPLVGNPEGSYDNNNHSFQWYYSVNDPTEDFENISKESLGDKDMVNLILSANGHGTGEQEFKEGYYFVLGTNILFGQTRNSISNVYHTSYAPADVNSNNFTISYLKSNNDPLSFDAETGTYSTTINKNSNANDILIKINVIAKPGNNRSSEIRYQWYDGVRIGNTDDFKYSIIPSATENVLRKKDLTDNVIYKCQVINNYNGNFSEQKLDDIAPIVIGQM